MPSKILLLLCSLSSSLSLISTGKSRYCQDIDALQKSHTASGTSFSSLGDICNGLERLDKLKGLPYGGAAPASKTPPKPLPKKSITLALLQQFKMISLLQQIH